MKVLAVQDFKRYKNYPPAHFSRWRFWCHWLTIMVLIRPFILWKFKPQVAGLENVPREGPFIVAANHISMYDPPLLSSVLKYPLSYLAKKELFQNRLAAEFFRFEGVVALDRESPDSATLKSALTVLRSSAKWSLALFPEGTRSKDGKILPLKKGVGSLASKVGCPVVPVGIIKTPHDKRIVRIGKPIMDVSNAEVVHEQVYEALVHLTQAP